MPARIPNVKMIKALIMAAGICGPNVKLLDYNRLAKINGWPSVAAITRRFDGWQKAKERAGLVENKTFCEDCLEKETCEIEDMTKCHYYDKAGLYFEPVDI